MKFNQELIGPEEAQKLLDRNYKDQRLIKTRLVQYLVKILKDGGWNSNLPQPIMVSESGELLDGQHRCMAIIKSGVKALCWVARGVPESAYPDIDSGVSRTLYDRVTFTPEARWLNKLVSSIVTQWAHYASGAQGRGVRITPSEARALFAKHAAAITWAAKSTAHEKGIGRVQVSVALAQMYERDPDKAQALADTVWGNDMRRTNGIRLREFLIAGQCPSSVTDGSNYGFSVYVYRTCVAVCRAELAGVSLKRLRTATWDD
jgi:hypothetical protein